MSGFLKGLIFMAVDTARLLSEVSKSVSTIRQTLESKILNGVKGNNPTNSDANAIKNLKNNIQKHSGITGSSTENVPDDVYTAFATMINNDLVSSKKITKFATNDFERTNQIANALKAGIKNEKTSISVNGTNYSIEYHIESFLGKGNSWANVSYKDNLENKKIILTWTNVGTQQGTQALAEYCSLLKDLDLELWKDFFKKVLTAGAKTWSVGNYGTQILNSINDKNYAKSFLKGLGVSTKQLSVSKFGQFIKDNAVGGDVIVSSAKLLKTLEKKQTALVTAVNKNNDKKIESKLKEFAKTCNQLETNLGLQKSNFSIGEFTILDVINKKKNITITGTKGNDNISNWGEKVTIKSGAGDDSITNQYTGENVKIFSENGNDTIFNSGENVKIFGENGNDTIFNFGENVTISGGKGSDTINNRGSDVTISGGNGNDSIYNEGDSYYDGNNKYHVNGYYNTINGGLGNDTIYNNQGSHNVIYGGNGNDSILNNGYEHGGYDGITYYGEDNTINGGLGNDTIKNSYGDYFLINGDSGNDYISDYFCSYNTINGGLGNDTICGDKVRYCKIEGGEGNDHIIYNSYSTGWSSYYYYSDSVTTNGGLGNDLITLTSDSNQNVIEYASGDGKDTIYGFNSDDTLQITKGNYKVSTKNNDVIVKVGTGKIILKDAVGKEISIKNSKGKVTTKTYGSSTSALLAENNFVTSDNLSEIVKNNLTPTALEKIETNNFENLTQENNLITFTEK